jgi:hypothetical protein
VNYDENKYQSDISNIEFLFLYSHRHTPLLLLPHVLLSALYSLLYPVSLCRLLSLSARRAAAAAEAVLHRTRYVQPKQQLNGKYTTTTKIKTSGYLPATTTGGSSTATPGAAISTLQ